MAYVAIDHLATHLYNAEMELYTPGFPLPGRLCFARVAPVARHALLAWIALALLAPADWPMGSFGHDG